MNRVNNSDLAKMRLSQIKRTVSNTIENATKHSEWAKKRFIKKQKQSKIMLKMRLKTREELKISKVVEVKKQNKKTKK
tara:strand:- start:5126 stop:5359 length:234 start_codon:yes stop_codon:yes gene_type:complete